MTSSSPLEVHNVFGVVPGHAAYSNTHTVVTIAGNALRFYDTKDRSSRFLWGAGSGISCFAVSAAGRMIAYVTKGLNPTIHVHAMGSMERVIALEGTAQAGVSALAFSRDGKFLAVASAVPDLTLSVRMARTGQVLVECGLESEGTGISFNPFNAFEVLVNHASGAPSGASGATVHVIDRVYETHTIETRPLNVQAAGVAPAAITAAVWSPENTVYLGTDAGALLVMRPGTGQVIAPPPHVSDAVIAGLISPEDAAAAADAGEDPVAGLPAVATSAWILAAGAGAVRAMAFTKHHIMMAGMDGALRFYTHASVSTASSGASAAQLERVVALADGEYEEVVAISFNPLFSEAIVSTAECGLYVVNIIGDMNPAGAAAVPSVEASSPPADGASMAGSESQRADAALAAAGEPAGAGGALLAEGSSASVADPVQVTKVGDFHSGAVTGVAPLADGTSVATCGVDGTLRGWDLATGACAWKRTLSSEQAAMTSGSLAAGSGIIAVSSATGVVRVFDAGAGAAAPPHLTLRARLTTDVPDAIAMNEAGTWLAVAGMYGDCWLVEIATARAARVVGYVPLPARALSMVWSSDNRLLVSGQGGQVASVTPPPPGYIPKYGLAIESADAPVQSVMVDCALTSICGGGGGGAAITGIAADRTLRTYTLPAVGDAAAWGGRDGQVLKPDVTVPDGLGKALGGVVAAGGIVATASNDGGVAVWAGAGGAEGAQLARMVHDSNEGGASALAVVPGGRLATAGLDGAVVVTSSPGMPELVVAAALAEGVAEKAAAPPAPEFDNFDDADEPTVMDQASAAALAEMQGAAAADAAAEAEAAAAAQLDPAVAASREAMAAKVADLRRRLEEMIARNDAAEELEKIPRKELLVDETFRTQLVAEGDERVAEVRKQLVRENLCNDYAGAKIKEECWDTMATHGSAVLSFKAPGLAVHNYPLRTADKSAKLAARVAFLRRVEMKEDEFLAQPENGGAEDIFNLRVDVPKEGEEGAGGEGEGGGGAAPAEGEGGADGGGGTAAAAASFDKPAEDSYEAILYDPFKLYPPRRKMSQLMLLQMVTREIKASFNAEFHEMTGTKTTYMDKLGEYNQRITEIRDELKSHTTDNAPLFEPKLSDLELDGSVLKVDDSEIKAEVYVSPEEEARLAAEAEAEAERLRSKGADDPSERALKEMMNGVLESDKGAAEMEELPKSDWMLETPKDEWTEEQQKLAKEWEGKAKAFKEELDKRRKALDAELKKLREDVEETTKKFDDHLAEFFERRNVTDSRLAEIDSWVVACAEEAETALDDDERRQMAIEEELAELKNAKGGSTAAVGNFRREVDVVRDKYEAAAAEDRQMDKHFKRDFAETDDYFEIIYTLYKRRKNPPRVLESESSNSGAGSRRARPSIRNVSRRVSNAAARMSSMRNPRASRNSAGSSIATIARMARNSNTSVSSEVGDEEAALKLVLAAKHDPFSGALGGPVTEASKRPKPPPVESLDLEFDRPEGLDATWWDRLVEHREKKIAKEVQVLALKTELDEMQRYLAKISDEDAKLQERIEELIVESREFAAARYDKLYDLSVPLKMKQGEVEVMLPDLKLGGGPKVRELQADSMLLHRNVVQDLNEVIQRHGGGKVDTLEAIKDFKKGIYDLQWENTKLHMESDDLVEKTKQLQLARVGKNFQEIIKGAAGKDEDGAGKKGELASLEARLDHNRKLHARNLAEKKKDLGKMRLKIKEKSLQNEEISTQVVEMDVSVGEQLRIKDQRGGEGAGGGSESNLNMMSSGRSVRSQNSLAGQGQGVAGGAASAAAERKMRALVTQQKLRDIAKAQAEEMMMLRTELERARLRTFPSFVERNGGHPDIR